MTTTFTLAHLSDPHLGPMPQARLRDLATEREMSLNDLTDELLRKALG